MVRDTPPSEDASTHQIWNSHLKEYRRYAPDTMRDGRADRRTDIVITIKTKSEVKVTVIRKWYATLCHPKMHPHTKFGIPTTMSIGDMHQTRSRTDSAITICLPKFLWGHKNLLNWTIVIDTLSVSAYLMTELMKSKVHRYIMSVTR